jgi:hypothetical protein
MIFDAEVRTMECVGFVGLAGFERAFSEREGAL